MFFVSLRVVVEHPRLGLIHEERATDRLARLGILIHGIVDVLDQAVAQLDVLATDAGYGLLVEEWLLVRLVIVIVVVSEPRQERAHDGPTAKELRVDDLSLPCCAKASNVTARHRLGGQTDTEYEGDVHLDELPVGRAVPGPQTCVAVNADKTTTSNDEMALGGLQALQALVGRFAKVVVEQAADFGERLLVVMSACIRVPTAWIEVRLRQNLQVAQQAVGFSQLVPCNGEGFPLNTYSMDRNSIASLLLKSHIVSSGFLWPKQQANDSKLSALGHFIFAVILLLRTTIIPVP